MRRRLSVRQLPGDPLVLPYRYREFSRLEADLLARGDGAIGALWGPSDWIGHWRNIGGAVFLLGEARLWAAEGTEFSVATDSSGDIQRVGAAAAPTWGTAGAEATGGMVLPVGTLLIHFAGAWTGAFLRTLARAELSIGGTEADGDAIGFGGYCSSPDAIWAGCIRRNAGAYTRQYVIGTLGAPSPGGTTTAAFQDPAVDGDGVWIGRQVFATYTPSQRGSASAGAWREADDTAAATSQQGLATTTSAITGCDNQAVWAWRSASNMGARITRIIVDGPTPL